jgi:hypothetical protein
MEVGQLCLNCIKSLVITIHLLSDPSIPSLSVSCPVALWLLWWVGCTLGGAGSEAGGLRPQAPNTILASSGGDHTFNTHPKPAYAQTKRCTIWRLLCRGCRGYRPSQTQLTYPCAFFLFKVWEGKEAVSRGRTMIGATNPSAWMPGTIRQELPQ